MAHLWFVAILVAASFIQESAQQNVPGGECKITSGLSSNVGANNTLVAAANCSTGVIAWHYPVGSLNVSFPRTVLSELAAHARKRIRVCFRGGLGEGVSDITQKLHRRNRIKTHKIKLVDSMTEWVCTRPSKKRTGVQVTLHATAEKYYIKQIHYRVEIMAPKKPNGGRGGNRGNRHGGRGGSGRGQGGRGQGGRGSSGRGGGRRGRDNRLGKHGNLQNIRGRESAQA